MEYEFKVKYSKEILNRAHIKYWKKKHLVDAVISPVLLIMASYLLFVSEVREWYMVLFFTVAFIFTAMVYGAFFIWRRQALVALNAMKVPEAQWKLNNDSLFLESDVAKVELPWTAIKKIWRFKEVWLLFYANETFSTLPTQDLSAEVLQFIENRVVEGNGKIS